jgi:hypothetical protein
MFLQFFFLIFEHTLTYASAVLAQPEGPAKGKFLKPAKEFLPRPRTDRIR